MIKKVIKSFIQPAPGHDSSWMKQAVVAPFRGKNYIATLRVDTRGLLTQYVKYAVKSVVRIGSAHNQGRPAHINIERSSLCSFTSI